jgi:hypothetical protein
LNWIKAQWAANGTKILGVLLTALAALDTASEEVLDLIPRESHWRGVAKLGFALLGYAILKRGEGNSRVLARPPP